MSNTSFNTFAAAGDASFFKKVPVKTSLDDTATRAKGATHISCKQTRPRLKNLQSSMGRLRGPIPPVAPILRAYLVFDSDVTHSDNVIDS